MNISNLYRTIKQILDNSNIALVNKGLNKVNSLKDIPSELARLEIDRLPYLLRKEIIEVLEDDLEGYTTITKYLFYDCTNLKNITIPSSVTTIDAHAFAYCRSLTSITIPNSVTAIKSQAFRGCNNLVNITLPEGITKIESHTFNFCNKLTNIIIPNSVTVLGTYAFGYCSSLTEITIPSSITTIEASVFTQCTNLANIYISSIIPPTLKSSNAFPTTITTIHVPVGSGDAYRSSTNWSSFADKIVEDIEIV